MIGGLTMTTTDIIITFLEIAGAAALIYYIFNEYKLITLEDKIKEKIKNVLEVIF